MRQFYEVYRDAPDLSTLVRELPWSTNLHMPGGSGAVIRSAGPTAGFMRKAEIGIVFRIFSARTQPYHCKRAGESEALETVIDAPA